MASPGKTKLTCFSCGSSYRLDLAKIPPSKKAFKCLNCGKPVPILDRVLTDRQGGPKPEEAPEAAVPAAAAEEASAAGGWEAALIESPPPPAEEAEAGEAWLAIYGDMMSILLLFFVLMFAISTLDKQKFQSVIEGVSQALGGSIKYAEEPVPGAHPSGVLDMLKNKVNQEQGRMGALQERLAGLIQREGLEKSVGLKDENQGLVIIGQDLAMFDSGRAEIKTDIRPFLLRLGKMLADVPNDIVVEGHTDDVPISTAQFASNWELSVARATNVLHFLEENCGLPPDRLSAAGYAFYRPRHAFVGPDAGKNRRIEIMIKKRYSDEFAADLAKAGAGADAATGQPPRATGAGQGR